LPPIKIEKKLSMWENSTYSKTKAFHCPDSSGKEDGMRAVLYLVSILWIVAGTCMVIYTGRTRAFFKKLVFTDNPKILAIVPAAFGLILVFGAFYVKNMFWLVFVLGLLCVAKGVYLFTAPPEQIKKLLEWWFEKADDGTFRLFGLIVFVLGISVFSLLL
jgi:uncharacterized protein YjeT (DUF2065 family)